MKTQAVIRGLGYHVPERVLTNEDLERMVDTSDEWITTRTGIKERRIAAPDETCASLALAAGRKALNSAGMAPEELTHIFIPTITSDYPTPSTAVLVSEEMGLKGRMALDINAACSGFVYSLQLAMGQILLEPDAKILIAATDVLSARTNFEDRTTCVLFGDGSGAAIVAADDGSPAEAVIRDVRVASDGGCVDTLLIPGGGSRHRYAKGDTVGEEYYIHMNGREVFKNAVRNMEQISNEVLERNNLTGEQIDLFLPHQANLRIIEALARKLNAPKDKVFVNVDRYGNTSAASVPIALAEARETGRIKPGYKVLVSTFGAGFTWGAALLEF